ncbi:MAG: cold shock domain-containing protein, partial [Planctomycetes bacterium]|nr:cold shock domain-containing protein [Planctomycetota bacterium]
MQGKIHRLIRGKGFGFIQAEGQQYFFHHTEVRGMEFRRLGVGDVVEFQAAPEVEPGKNPRAVELTLVAKAEPPPLDALAAPPEPVRSGERGVRRPAAGRPASPRRAPSRDASGAGIVEEELEAAEFGDELVLEHQPAVLSPPGPVSSPLGPPEGTVGALPERAARPEGAVGARAGEG